MTLHSGGDESIGKTLARAGVRRPSRLDWVRLVEWRKLKDAGVPSLAAFVTVATHADYGFEAMRGMPSLPPSSAATLFAAFVRRMAPDEVERARAETVVEIVSSAPDAARRMAHLSTATEADGIDSDLARVNIAAGRVILEAVGVVGGKGSTSVTVSQQVAQMVASSGPSPQDIAARIASDPVAQAAMRALLDRLDPSPEE